MDAVTLLDGRGGAILRAVSLDLDPGEAVWLEGASQAGKTATLQVLGLQRRPSSGRVLLGDTRVGGPFARRRLRNRIGFVWQESRLLPHLTLAENLALPARLQGLPEAETTGRVGELLAWIGLTREAGLRPGAIGAFARRSLAVARAVMCVPDLLLVDEPHAGLSRAEADRVLDLLGALHAAGTTLVVATRHEPDPRRIRGRRLRLDDGQLAEAD